ncbi:MAG: hypothetical protein OEW12_10155, partial [Deltaproteobacteria bacterium]|nr:hypothetical protein [Deltaproteobacteria bacterium]
TKIWDELMEDAVSRPLEGDGYLYLIADSHLGDSRAPEADFVAMLARLEKPVGVVLLGDLFKVWLAPPRFLNPKTALVLDSLQQCRAGGVWVALVVGNREFFVPTAPEKVAGWGLPFDVVADGALLVAWGGRRYGFTHGDLANRQDVRYLRWRRLARGSLLARLFGMLPGFAVRWISRRGEQALGATNREIKISYPRQEVEKFAQRVAKGLDGFFIGHFHKEGEVYPPEGGVLRMVPDWFSTRKVGRLAPDGTYKVLIP